MLGRSAFVFYRILIIQQSKQLPGHFSLMSSRSMLPTQHSFRFCSTLISEKKLENSEAQETATVAKLNSLFNDLSQHDGFTQTLVKQNLKVFKKFKVENINENKELLLMNTGEF